MSLLAKFKAILFDMDGLMFNSEILFHRAWQESVTALGYTFDDKLYLELVGRSNTNAEQLMFDAFGAGFPLVEFRSDWMTRWQQLVASQGVTLKPGLLQLLDALDAKNIPKAVGTSSNATEARTLLGKANLWDRFTTVVTVDDVEQGKPAPDIYLLAAQRLGIAPANCLVLEDSNAGVEAAIAAGSSVLMVPDLQVPTPYSQEHALSICTSLQDVAISL